MCGRALISESKELAAKTGVEEGGAPQPADVNRPPGTVMPMILDARPGKLHYILWGLIPNWATDRTKNSNKYARRDTMHTKPSFRELIGRRHCVFVMDGLYEFDQRVTPSQPYYTHRKDKQVIRLAGIWDTWKDTETGIIIPSAAVITKDTTGIFAKIHDRMPIALSEGETATWLDRELSVHERMQVLFKLDQDVFEGWVVDKRVNNARNKDADLPFPLDGSSSLFD